MISKYFAIVVITCALVATAFAINKYGTSMRKVLSTPKVQQAEKNREIYRIWEEHKVKGRTLLLFDRHLHAQLMSGISDDNYIRYAYSNNIIRKIYHIIPGSSWPEVETRLSAEHSFNYRNGRFNGLLHDCEVHVTPLHRLPRIKETVLVVIDCRYWTGPELSAIFEQMKNKTITTDLLVVSSAESCKSAGAWKDVVESFRNK